MTCVSDTASTGKAPRAARERWVYLAAVLVFVAAAAATLYFCRAMSDGMAMPGGWTMSMMWMPMAGQSWAGAAAMFLGMWLAMMVAMMLPSALPMLVIYRRVLAFRGEGRRAEAATVRMACGYFFVWLMVGAMAYAIGVAAAWATMRWAGLSRAVPAASGAALLLCGLFQFTPWKRACLRHCRDPLSFAADHLSGGRNDGWKLGLHHGAFCVACCWALMAIQLVLGVMNLAVMALVATVIALEKLIPRADLVVRLTGAAAMAAGTVMIVRQVWHG